MTQDNQGRSGIVVPERFIPTPTTVSPAAQAFLSMPSAVGSTQMPPASDLASWRTFSAEADRGLLAFIGHYEQMHPAKVQMHHVLKAPIYELTPSSTTLRSESQAILYMHGGGFMMGGGQLAMYAALPIASLARIRTFSVDYRMPPDHPFPVGLEDCVQAYQWLLSRHDAKDIVLYGPSAGGNLVPACLLKAKTLGLPMPAACVLHSPAADASESGDTYETNYMIDIVLKHRLPELFKLYAGGHNLKDPLVSPAFAQYTHDFPPTLLSSGTRDLLLSSTVLLHRAMRRGGVKAELHVFEAMTHAPFFGSPEEQELMGEHVQFIHRHVSA
jgi:acetyl esterase/lipase